MWPIGRRKSIGNRLVPSTGSRAGAWGHGPLLGAVLLLGALVAVDGQSIVFTPGSPSLVLTYDWQITKTVGGTAGVGGALTVTRGASVEIPYTVTVLRVLVGPAQGKLSFSVTCGKNSPGDSATSVTISEVGGGLITSTPAAAGGVTTFKDVAFKAPDAPSDTVQGRIFATCVYPSAPTTIEGAPVDIIYNSGNTQQVRATASLTDVVTWPTWSTYFPTGNWLTTPPTTALTSGTAPSQGVSVIGPFPVVYTYSYTVSNTLLCFQGAQVSNVATLTAGTAGQDQRTYKAEAAATLSVTGCDVSPALTLDQPNLQTSLTYAWTQAITPLSPAAVTVPWGGGGTVEAQAAFTRTVTSATFQASFTVTIANPVAAPIALTNLQLVCPWGGNILLPCGSMAGLAAGTNGGLTGFSSNNFLVVPASGSVNCMVNNLQIPATWGSDYTQPCSIITSNWLGTQVTLQGIVLDFSSPQRWQTINNCALWSVTCSVPTGNAFYVPTLGGMPASQQVCGSESSNAPLPPQTFSVAFSGGWVGDGTQAAACVSGVTTTCTSQLQLQSTQGTTQSYGGTQTNTMTLQAMPTDCPKPPPPPPSPPTPILLPSPSPSPFYGLMSAMPLVTATVTKTHIRGEFVWGISSSLTPSDLAVAQGSAGVLSRYTVVATPEPVPGAAPPQYQLEGFVTVVNANPNPVRVDEVYVVVDTAAVALGCKPGLPGILSPSARVDCGFLVNYNMVGTPNTLLGRAVVVSDLGGRTNAEGSPVLFSFDSADASGAKGACARVSQTYATNWFDLVQVWGVAPSFDPDSPTTVCSPVTWKYDVRFTPRPNAPCAVQQVVQTVTAEYFRDSQTGVQASNTANLFITGPSCPLPPAGYVIGSANTVVDTPATSTATATTPSNPPTTNTGSSSSSSTPAPAPSSSSATSSSTTELSAPPPGLSVVLSEVQTARSAAPVWELTMQPADNETAFELGKAGAVNFKLSWSKLPQATDYSGTVTVINNAKEPAELDGVYVNLLNTLADGESTDEVMADCPVGAAGALGQITGANPYTVPANGRLSCKFSLRSVSSGSLVGTATGTEGGDGTVSKQVSVQRLMADGNCGKLLSGLAASELGQGGVLLAGKGVTEEEVCSAGSSTVKVAILADAALPAAKGCVAPVVAMAWMKPYDLSTTGAVAYAKCEVRIAGCVTPQAAAPSAAVSGLSLSKGRMLKWVVNITTDPPVGETFEGKSLAVTTTWQQKSELGLNASGEVVVKGTGSATKAQLVAIPLCGPGSSPDCVPVTLQANLKTAADNKDVSRGTFNFTKLPFVPGLLLASVDQAAPAAAQPYDLARARWGGRSALDCAVLTEDRTLASLDDESPAADAVVTGAVTALPSAPFCGAQLVRNYTLSFEKMKCESVYAFTATASATPAGADAKPVSGELSFDVTC